MSKYKNYLKLLTVILIGLLIFSCSEYDLTDSSFKKEEGKTRVSLDLAKRVALNFTKDEAFIGKFEKGNLKVALRSTKNSKSVPFPGFEEREIDEVLEIDGSSGQTALYILKFLPNGYIIVSSTRKDVPILAFSNNGVFNENDIPLGIQDWINHRTKIIEQLEADDEIEVSEEIKEQWDCVAPPIGNEEIISGGNIHEQTGPLLETRWSQGRGYNESVRFFYCPDGTTPTGCVATAMSQVMRYWEYPSSYNWSIMPNQITEDTPLDNSTNEIAELMYDVGLSVTMEYSCFSSGAYTSKARNALVNTFGYASYASYVNFNANTIVQQLEWNQPVILRGEDSSQGGHTWVCDGCRRIKYTTIHNPGTYYEYETYTFSHFYLHMNWGWNDNFNANDNWFFHGEPAVDGNNFSIGYKMIIKIHP